MSGEGENKQYWDNLLTPILNDKGQIVQILCMSRDVTAQRQTEIQLRISSELDELTGLYNRRFFKLQLKRALQRHKKSEKFLA